VLAIPREEIEAHFAENSRQDLKLVTAEILSYDLFKVLKAKGKDLKMEERLAGLIWKHSGPDSTNSVVPSCEFIAPDIPQYAAGPMAVSFASGNSFQDDHFHKQHLEVLFSDHELEIEFRDVEETVCQKLTLATGGLLVVAPNTVHRLRLTGLSILIELPSLARDKYDCKLR